MQLVNVNNGTIATISWVALVKVDISFEPSHPELSEALLDLMDVPRRRWVIIIRRRRNANGGGEEGGSKQSYRFPGKYGVRESGSKLKFRDGKQS